VKGPNGEYFDVEGRTLKTELWYPRRDDRPNEIRVGLVDVRAADDILIRYDFSRDGWAIHQNASDTDDPAAWQEVAFIKAWALDAANATD
jgi:hypothetical protein